MDESDADACTSPLRIYPAVPELRIDQRASVSKVHVARQTGIANHSLATVQESALGAGGSHARDPVHIFSSLRAREANAVLVQRRLPFAGPHH
jgi:hypothetical protein